MVAAERVDGGHQSNTFRFSFANQPDGPFMPAFTIAGADRPKVAELPSNWQGKLYVKVESTDASPSQLACDQLRVDAMAISHRSDISPYAQGDLIVSFIDLVKDSTFPIVLYRPSSVITDLGLYGSSHVGSLGGIVKPTNVDGILQLDLIKTDYFHDTSYPTFLYYNPYGSKKTIVIDVGSEAKDLYDAVSNSFVLKNTRGNTTFIIPPDTACVVVLTPAGGLLTHDGPHTFINRVIVDSNNEFQEQSRD